MKIPTECTNKDIFEMILSCLKKNYPPEKTVEEVKWKFDEADLEKIVKFVCEVYDVKTKQQENFQKIFQKPFREIWKVFL